jgi:hypothetical protein
MRSVPVGRATHGCCACTFTAYIRIMATPKVAAVTAFPHRFGALSDRLTMQNGVLLMGGASFLMLLYTRGSVDALVVMHAINVFVTFALSQLGMIGPRRSGPAS